jgi:hypothetical protein
MIEGFSKVQNAVGNLGFIAFSKVKSIELDEVDEIPSSSYSLILVLETMRRDDNFRLRVRFTRVKNLALKHFGGWPTQITGLDIIDVSGDQQEEIGFRVTDYENSMISLSCENAIIESVEAIH